MALTDSELIELEMLIDLRLVEKAQDNLFDFTKYTFPKFQDTWFHTNYYRILDLFARGLIKKLIITVPPQHGKSQGSTIQLPADLIGHNPDLHTAIVCYSATKARKFGRKVKQLMSDENYQKCFSSRLGGSKDSNYINTGEEMEIVGFDGSLKCVGYNGGLTGDPVDVLLMDDLYKSWQEANSPIIRERVKDFYITVAETRLHNDSQQLIVFTRWHDDDLVGFIEKNDEVILIKNWSDIENADPKKWYKINFEAIKIGEPTEIDPRLHGEPLWPQKHNLEKLLKSKSLDAFKFECLYQGNPGNSIGRLYKPFKTWIDKKDWGTYIRSGNYTDVADEGSDYLFSVCYDIYKSENMVFNEIRRRFEPLIFALVTDMEMTDQNTDVTTITVPAMINRNGTQKAWVESNAGGAQFEKVLKRKVKAYTEPFYQSGNKESRIVTSSSFVSEHIIMPFGWEVRFKPIYDHLTEFLRDFPANKHDDPEDGLTGVYEKEIADGNIKPYSYESRGIKRRN